MNRRIASISIMAAILLSLSGDAFGDVSQKLESFLSFFQATLNTLQDTLQKGEDNSVDTDTIPENWFDDAIFIGDSQTGALSIYNLVNGGLGKTLIFHVNGMSCHSLVNEDRRISFNGRSCTIGEAVSLSGASKVFLLLAMNDIGTMPDKDLEKCWETLIDHIRADEPDAVLYIQSATPIRANRETAWITKENTDSYNKMLKSFCKNNGCIYVDITDNLSDESGYLKQEYCRDNLHLNNDGCAVWVENLKNPGSYTPSYKGKSGE